MVESIQTVVCENLEQHVICFAALLPSTTGIMSLAFALIVSGGFHPRGKTTSSVPAIDRTNFTNSIQEACKIFYRANTDCLTPNSDFLHARFCTEQHAGPCALTSVSRAWSAVGVGPLTIQATKLSSGTSLLGQSANTGEVKHYFLEGVRSSESVTCSIQNGGGAGNADHFLRFIDFAVPCSSSTLNACNSTGPGNSQMCTTPVNTGGALKVFAAVKAEQAYSGLTIKCSRNGCTQRGGSCTFDAQCCNGTCERACIICIRKECKN
jgi:Thermolysin metallopeptidase, alpha-helical domain